MNVGKQPDTSYFLAGELSSQGWWYYHLVAFALKSSLPMLLLALGCLAHALLRGGMGRREYALWIPIALIFLSNALFNSLQLGVRHVLPAYPLLFVAISPRVRFLLAGFRAAAERATALAAAAALLLAWHAAGTLAVAPRYLQFFNELAGGAEGGHRWLIDSNLDWGQDLIRLREYLQRERIDVVNLAYFGRVNPKVYGIRFVPLERDSRGIAVISASFLMGRPYLWYLEGRMRWVPAETYRVAARARADRARGVDARATGWTDSDPRGDRHARPRAASRPESSAPPRLPMDSIVTRIGGECGPCPVSKPPWSSTTPRAGWARSRCA